MIRGLVRCVGFASLLVNLSFGQQMSDPTQGNLGISAPRVPQNIAPNDALASNKLGHNTIKTQKAAFRIMDDVSCGKEIRELCGKQNLNNFEALECVQNKGVSSTSMLTVKLCFFGIISNYLTSLFINK